MERERLIIETPTMQVCLLTEEYLSDGNIHTRKEIVKYIEEQREALDLPEFNTGHINGGISRETKRIKYESLSRGTFRLKQCNKEKSTNLTYEQRIIDILNNVKLELVDVSKEIDYINASSEELNLLNKMKDCIRIINDLKEKFETQ